MFVRFASLGFGFGLGLGFALGGVSAGGGGGSGSGSGSGLSRRLPLLLLLRSSSDSGYSRSSRSIGHRGEVKGNVDTLFDGLGDDGPASVARRTRAGGRERERGGANTETESKQSHLIESRRKHQLATL